MSEKLFSKKIHYLHKKLNLKEKEFTKLFWDGDRDKFNSRHNTIHESWLGTKGIKQVKGFYFDEYPISDLKIEDKIAFTKDLFMYESFENFQEIVDDYLHYISKPKKLFEYKYIYFYDRRKNKIFHSELKVIERIHDKEYRVELLMPKANKDSEIYNGILKLNSEYYHISVENSFEILTLYFVVGRGYGKKKKVNGIGLGLTYDSGLPQATKELMTKEKLTKEEENDFYLIANEIEYIRSDESLYELNSDKKVDYLNQFHKRVDDLGNYTKQANSFLNTELEDDIYLSIFNETFQRFHKISQKVESEQEFHIFRRRNAIENFLKHMLLRKNSRCSIVYPLFENDTDLFDKTEDRCKGFLELNIELAKEGLKLKRIFVIDEDYKVTDYFISSIQRFIESGIEVKIAFKNDIDQLNIGSYDFLLTEDRDVALYKNIRDKIHIYYVTKNEEQIQGLFFDYKKIEEISFSFDDFLTQKDLKKDRVLEQLVGKWYYYIYGSMKDENNQFKLWHIEMDIDAESNLTYTLNNEKFTGYLETCNFKNQSFIKLNSPSSEDTSIISINNKHIYKHIFKVSMIDKQLGLEEDMFTFGIFSKLKLSESTIKKVLGNIDEVILRESIELEQRINELYLSTQF